MKTNKKREIKSMKTAASIFSWLGGLVTTIIGFVYLSLGQTATYLHCNYYSCSNYTQKIAYPAWMWVLWVIFIIVRLIILIWRQIAVGNGNKVGCGVCTLLFASLIGGILTLCIPEDQLTDFPTSNYHPSTSYSSSVTYNRTSALSMAAKEKEYNEQFSNHEITKEEYDSKMAKLNMSRPIAASKPSSPMSESNKIELIERYKKLYDAGAITEEEFAKKKAELLEKK